MKIYREPKREYHVICKVCYKQFVCNRITAKYCSNACRQVHKRIVTKQRQDYQQSRQILEGIKNV